MARALVVTHSPDEPPGTLDEWLPAAGLELDVVQPWQGDPLPPRVTEHAALVVMGGPQQAYDDGSAPWLRATKELLRAAVVDTTWAARSLGYMPLRVFLNQRLPAAAGPALAHLALTPAWTFLLDGVGTAAGLGFGFAPDFDFAFAFAGFDAARVDRAAVRG